MVSIGQICSGNGQLVIVTLMRFCYHGLFGHSKYLVVVYIDREV